MKVHVFLAELEKKRTRLRQRVIALVSVVALAGVGCAVRVSQEAESTPMSPVVSRPLPASVDGGHPLLLDRPGASTPSRPAARPVVAGVFPSVFGIPVTVFNAYLRAADSLAVSDPGCGLTWPVLAGIGRVESDHARNGDVTAYGDMVHPIYGPPLNGTKGTAAIRGPNGNWARAVGPMQILPSTWAEWASDGHGDGRADPKNVFDASLAAARYLCADSSNLSTNSGLHSALLRYNPSEQYASAVMRWIRAYQYGGFPVAEYAGGSAVRVGW